MKIVFAEPLGVSITELEKTKAYFENKGHSFVYYSDRNDDPEEWATRVRQSVSGQRIPCGFLPRFAGAGRNAGAARICRPANSGKRGYLQRLRRCQGFGSAVGTGSAAADHSAR